MRETDRKFSNEKKAITTAEYDKSQSPPADSAREREVAIARRKLAKRMEKEGCHAPFSIQSVTALATPRKPTTQQPTYGVISQLRKSAQELLNRAFAGEQNAIKEFCWFAHNLVRQLTYLSDKKKTEIAEIASTYEDWPILYTPDDTTSLGIYNELAVGTDSFLQRYAGRKIDYNNPWTNRALLVLELMQWCKQRLPEIIRDNRPCRKMSPCFVEVGRTKIPIYYYETPNGIFEIPEWCELCPGLPNKLRPDTVDQFWKVARLAILEHWARGEFFGPSPSPYGQALNGVKLRKGRNCESLQRADVLDGIKRAIRSLAGKETTLP